MQSIFYRTCFLALPAFFLAQNLNGVGEGCLPQEALLRLPVFIEGDIRARVEETLTAFQPYHAVWEIFHNPTPNSTEESVLGTDNQPLVQFPTDESVPVANHGVPAPSPTYAEIARGDGQARETAGFGRNNYEVWSMIRQIQNYNRNLHGNTDRRNLEFNEQNYPSLVPQRPSQVPAFTGTTYAEVVRQASNAAETAPQRSGPGIQAAMPLPDPEAAALLPPNLPLDFGRFYGLREILARRHPLVRGESLNEDELNAILTYFKTIDLGAFFELPAGITFAYVILESIDQLPLNKADALREAFAEYLEDAQ
jgi:hypothetical protein